jgi:hypothetical protein
MLARLLFEKAPWPWQRRLAERNRCDNLLIRIPTGFGKTLGVLHAWLPGNQPGHRTLWRVGFWMRK